MAIRVINSEARLVLSPDAPGPNKGPRGPKQTVLDPTNRISSGPKCSICPVSAYLRGLNQVVLAPEQFTLFSVMGRHGLFWRVCTAQTALGPEQSKQNRE